MVDKGVSSLCSCAFPVQEHLDSFLKTLREAGVQSVADVACLGFSESEARASAAELWRGADAHAACGPFPRFEDMVAAVWAAAQRPAGGCLAVCVNLARHRLGGPSDSGNMEVLQSQSGAPFASNSLGGLQGRAGASSCLGNMGVLQNRSGAPFASSTVGVLQESSTSPGVLLAGAPSAPPQTTCGGRKCQQAGWVRDRMCLGGVSQRQSMQRISGGVDKTEEDYCEGRV